MQNVELISFTAADELARAVASAWLDEIEAANRAGKTHCVALSGGRIARKFFTSVVEQAKAEKLGTAARRPSQRTFIFSGRTSGACRRMIRNPIFTWRRNGCSSR